MQTAERSVKLLLDVITRLGDVVGEPALRSLLHYAASQVATDAWSQLMPPRRVETALEAFGEALGTRIELVKESGDEIVLRIEARRPQTAAVERAREAIVTGFLQGLERSRTGRTPRIRINNQAAAPTASRGETDG